MKLITMDMGKNAMVFLLFVMVMMIIGYSMATVYTVGDSAGWTIVNHPNYTHWASTKRFHAGDTLLFSYHTEYHNVNEVKKEDFNPCNAKSPIATYLTGSDYIKLPNPGHYYFICGTPGHCMLGQKVHIHVLHKKPPTSYHHLYLLAPTPGPVPHHHGSGPSPSPISTGPTFQVSKFMAVAVLAIWVTIVFAVY
ncbi:mavicyanin-like [Quillaja saponaria]|uniref:Mavicyanin-like n=1 Tax=Quillaja saponaria TaxID=32244 RepID=A0AAD7Q0Z9_QUISA|nr:mavicyanin-like [Quillaja saponaria]